MKILYIHQFFKTPEEGGGIRSYYLAKALVDAGHKVEMISSHNDFTTIQEIDGIKVHYLRIPYNNSYGFIKRILAYGRFVLVARKRARLIQNVDLGYVMTTPLTTGWIAMWIKRRLKVSYFFEVGDLWPDVPIEMGAIKNDPLKKWLLKKEKQFYDEAERVIAMSPPQVENIKSKTKTPVDLIPNMADTEFFETKFRSQEITDENPLKVLYCGAHGRANQLEFLVSAAKESEDLPISFTLMGAGFEKKNIQGLAEDLLNVTFMDHGSKEEVRTQIELHDAVYLSFQNLPMLHTGCPNKFFDALASGKMVFSNLSGWTADIIQKERIGFSYEGENPKQFTSKIVEFLSLENVRRAQEASINLSNDYSRSGLSERLLFIVENR